MLQGRRQGGFARIFQEAGKRTFGGAPYVGDGGGLLMCYGINDLGTTGPLGMTQTRGAFIHAMRAAISLWRAARVFDNTDTSIVYGAGFALVGNTAEWSFGSSTRNATSTGNATFTITLPADYDGSPVVICLDGQNGAGGTVTLTGSAGVTGTVSTSNIVPAGLLSRTKVVHRITNLTPANAGQTIVGTVTSLGAGGTVAFDAWWIEAKAAPPVIVCDIPRLATAGYGFYGGWSGSEAAKDADVVATNDAIKALAAEFDGMVQVADLDAALSKDPTLFVDGLHPNERGAAKCADAVLAAISRLQPTSGLGATASFNVPSPRIGGLARPRIQGGWYTAEARAEGPAYTPTIGDLWFIPLMITGARDVIVRLAISVSAAGSVSPTLRWGLYDDVGWTGQPQTLIQEATSGGVFTVPLATGLQQSPASGAGAIYLPLDPGLYWLAIKTITAGTGQTWRSLSGPVPCLPNVRLSDASLLVGAGFRFNQGTGALPGTAPTVSDYQVADEAPMMCAQVFVT
ncbi:hypothetical protein [Sphaerisporangium sp. NPDC051011]|uniref:hypothetical protein n=1 Tax=Sphaerisporangium sp. NPDC051011 TaxID=3155792 RepID=UPI0033CF69FB